MASIPAASLEEVSNTIEDTNSKIEVIWYGKKQRKEENTYMLEELLLEILVRVPAKSVVRFKSVCKSWHSMLDSRSFADWYHRRHCSDYPEQIVYSPQIRAGQAPKQSFLVAGPSHLRLPHGMRLRKPRKTSFFIEIWSRVYSVFGPLNNGMYCLVGNVHNVIDGRVFITGGKMAFCNPATHDYKFTKPFPRYSRDLLSNVSMSFKFPRRISYGFGLSKAKTASFDYKIVVVINWGVHFSSFLSFVYSLCAGEWKQIADYNNPGLRGHLVNRNIEGLFILGDMKCPEITQDLELCPQRFFNGCWHWMAKVGDNRRYSVLSFNFGDEAFKLIGGPEGYIAHDSVTNVYVKGGVLLLNDHLAAIYLSHNELANPSMCKTALQCVGVDVWMMMEYGVVESWMRIYTIKPNFYGELRRLVGITAWPLRNDDKESGGVRIERIFFASDDRRIMCFNDFGYEEHGVCETFSFICWNMLGISTYKETLERL